MMRATRKQIADISHDALKMRSLFSKFTEKGIIIRPDHCDSCKRIVRKEEQMDGHHEDYSRIFDVLWVCLSCHRMIHLGTKKLADEDKQAIVQNRRDIMKRLAKKYLSGGLKRIKGRYYEYNKKPIIKTNIYPPEIVECNNIKVAICQSCLHVWVIRNIQPLRCPACIRLNNWEKT
jgi:hypothetical protein